MNIHIVTVGSRGDIEPLFALALGLERRGHAVHVVANSDGRQRAEQLGVPFADLGFSVAELLASGRGRTMLESGSSHDSRAALLDAAAELHPIVGPRIVASCAGADAILSTETVHLLSASIAEQQRVPHVAVGFVPYGRTTEYRSFYADTPELRTLSNLETHDAVERYHHRRLLPAVNALRRTVLGLPELTAEQAFDERETCAAILGYSPAVCPPPADWPPQREVTGYWTLPATGDVPERLAAFVAGGSPPLYVGFGSMLYRPATLVPLLLEAAAATGIRIVYATGWVADDRATSIDWPETFFVARDVPHQWLFPRVLGALHHGGAGTTAAAIRAGVPSVIAWMIVDQAFWAGRVAELGAGLDAGNFHALRSGTLIDAVARLTSDPVLVQKTTRLADHVRAEDGVSRAVEAVERHIAQFRGSQRG